MNDALSVVGTVATVPGIIAITNLAKGLGLSGRWSALVAVVLGVVLSVGQWAWSSEGWWSAVTAGLLLGLGAVGLYDITPSAGTGSKVTALVDGLPDGVTADVVDSVKSEVEPVAPARAVEEVKEEAPVKEAAPTVAPASTVAPAVQTVTPTVTPTAQAASASTAPVTPASS